MQSLYQRVLAKSTDLKTVDNLVSSSGLLNEITDALNKAGYWTQNLSMRQKSILFAALCDVIVVVRDKDYYLATFNCDKVVELMRAGRIIPGVDERDLSGAERVMRNNTREIVNQFLQQGKFHLIKLSVYERSRTSFSLFSVSSMNPYPNLGVERVYSMRKLAAWHETLYNELVKGCYKLKMLDGHEELCQSYLSLTRSVSSGGLLVTHDLNGQVKELPVWDVVSYEAYSPDDFVMQLYRGVVKYDGHDITLNRGILNKYYGEALVNSKLESKGARARFCLEDVLSVSSQRKQPDEYAKRYGLFEEVGHCETMYELECKLRSMVSKEKPFDSHIINARVLASPKAILAGHVSYYIKINTSRLSRHTISTVDNIIDVMPKVYRYFGVSNEGGYAGVSVNAVSDGTAAKYGAVAYKNRFGVEPKLVSLSCCGKMVRGSAELRFDIADQRRILMSIQKGYRQNYPEYSRLIIRVLRGNGLFQCNDEMLQLIFVNGLAKKVPDAGKLMLVDVVTAIVDFAGVLSNMELLGKKLFEAKCFTSYLSVKKEFKILSARFPDFTGYHVMEVPDGKIIVTEFGKYKIGKQGINKTVTLMYRGEELARKQIRV